MDYEQIVRETDQVIRDTMMHSVIAGTIMLVLTAIITAMFFVLAINEYKARKAERLAAEKYLAGEDGTYDDRRTHIRNQPRRGA